MVCILLMCVLVCELVGVRSPQLDTIAQLFWQTIRNLIEYACKGRDLSLWGRSRGAFVTLFILVLV